MNQFAKSFNQKCVFLTSILDYFFTFIALFINSNPWYHGKNAVICIFYWKRKAFEKSFLPLTSPFSLFDLSFFKVPQTV